MKKIMILALAALPFFSVAQDKVSTAGAVAGKPAESKFAIANPEIVYVELILSTNSTGAQTIKADFGREILTSLSDKDLSKQLMEMRTMAFPSVPDAMNYFASMGYKFQQNYVTYDKEGKADTHIVYEKRMSRKQGPDGVAKPRPDAGTRPATEANPKEKAPSVKPDEKGKK